MHSSTLQPSLFWTPANQMSNQSFAVFSLGRIWILAKVSEDVMDEAEEDDEEKTVMEEARARSLIRIEHKLFVPWQLTHRCQQLRHAILHIA